MFTKRLWMASIMLILAMALASVAVVAAEAQAGSFSDGSPKQVLMRGQTVLQHGLFNYSGWHWYEDGRWNAVYADGLGNFPREGVLVRAGGKLHIKTNKPERPARFTITAYRQNAEHPGWPIGEGTRLHTTLRRVEQGGKTVGWNVFFSVKEPNRHYLLETYGRWERVPGTHISYGYESRHYHVKTAEVE